MIVNQVLYCIWTCSTQRNMILNKFYTVFEHAALPEIWLYLKQILYCICTCSTHRNMIVLNASSKLYLTCSINRNMIVKQVLYCFWTCFTCRNMIVFLKSNFYSLCAQASLMEIWLKINSIFYVHMLHS